MLENKIMLAHGSGGKLMHDLIGNFITKRLNNPILQELSDAAYLDCPKDIAFTTDSFVVSPLFFPGGDIGKLAVCGTVNDLVMMGSKPLYLSLGLIIEEGFEKKLLDKIIDSISIASKDAGVLVVTGDTKVVEKGACDKIFINTSGLGRLISKNKFSVKNIKPGDKVIVTGNIAEHGLAVLAKRNDLSFGFGIKSDCASLGGMILSLLKNNNAVKFMRDPTRGGLATTLNEVTASTHLGIVINEKNVPLGGKSKAACELLGIDPLYVANEGKAVLIVENKSAKNILLFLKKHRLGRRSAIIGEVVSSPKGRVILNTVVGTSRILDMLTTEQLPRIC